MYKWDPVEMAPSPFKDSNLPKPLVSGYPRQNEGRRMAGKSTEKVEGIRNRRFLNT